MDYRRAYISLIARAKRRKAEDLDPSQKYEWHHYFPVCFWRDKSQNTKTVPLTLREHWIAHKLLFKLFPSPGTAAALICMARRMPKMNSRKFEALRLVIHDHNWTKTPDGRKYLSVQMKKRWESGEWDSDGVRQKWSKTAKRTQAGWREEGCHPLSSPRAREKSRQRAKERNAVINTCSKCGAVIGGGTGNMVQHQRGKKCADNAASRMVESRKKGQ